MSDADAIVRYITELMLSWDITLSIGARPEHAYIVQLVERFPNIGETFEARATTLRAALAKAHAGEVESAEVESAS